MTETAQPLDLPDRRLAKRIAFYREKANLTRASLATLLGTDEADITGWEEGLTTVYARDLGALSEALDVTPHVLLGWGMQ